ncbi:hypothetical protein QOT17_025355 [Balamuthia mandrillaris]
MIAICCRVIGLHIFRSNNEHLTQPGIKRLRLPFFSLASQHNTKTLHNTNNNTMYGKAILLLLGFLLVSQAYAASSVNAKLSGSVDVSSSIADITAKLQSLFSVSLGEDIEISVLTSDLIISFDTNALDEPTVEFEASELTDDGFFEGTFRVNDLSLALTVTLNDEPIEGSVSFSLVASARAAATFEDDSISFSLEHAVVSIEELSLDASGLGATIAAALEGSLEASINAALEVATEAIVEFGNSLVVVVEAPLRDVFDAIPRVTVTIESTVQEFEEDREAIVSAFVQVLADLEIGAFANGILIGDYSAGASGEVDFDFWILDNEDDVTGEEASSELQSAYESDAEVFAEAGVNVKSFKVNGSVDADGDGDSAARVASVFF